MALPKKIKYTQELIPPKSGHEYLQFGLDRIEELMLATDIKTKHLPRTILFEDIDQAVFDYINDGKLRAVIDGKIVPTFYLDNDRWGEFKKTWKFMDNDKNVPTPYITIRRSDKKPGTRIGQKYKVPQLRKFRYSEIPCRA